MASSNINKHLTLEERKIIEKGITNGSTKSAIAKTLGKDKSTIGKEIKAHRVLTYKCSLPLECKNYKKCLYGRECYLQCPDYIPFACSRRDRSPGACNGCERYKHCRFDKFRYSADLAHKSYKTLLVSSREGIDISEEELKAIGEIIQPLIKNGQSVYQILQNHPEINLSEKTIYTYIIDNSFKNVGVDLIALDLRNQVSRKIKKKASNSYKKRKDSRYLNGRLYKDYLVQIEIDPTLHIVQMDTVYNNVSKGPFLQTFKFLEYGFTFIILHYEKTSESMYQGILLLESILGRDLFNQEVQIILTDRGSEFTKATEIEFRSDGTRRTRIFYCDPMAAGQKGSLEQNHKEIRYICPKECDLFALGLTDQSSANRITSHINSSPKEKLHGKSPLELMEFLCPSLAKKFYNFGITKVDCDKVTLKPYLLKK